MASIEFFGEQFTLHPDGLNETAFMLFSRAARDADDGDADSTGESLAAVMDMAESCIADDEQRRFIRLALKKRAKSIDYMPIIQALGDAGAERPTGSLSDSPSGPTSTEPSAVQSYDVRLWEASNGRVDIYNGLLQARADVA